MLHVTSSFPRFPDDPTAPFLADLARVQADAGLEVHVLAPHGPGLASHERFGPVEVHRFRYAPQSLERLAYGGGLLAGVRRPPGPLLVPGFVLAMARVVGRLVDRLQPQVVHAHWWLPAGLAAGAALGRGRPGVALVVTLHGSDVVLARRPPLRQAAQALLSRAAVVGAVSDTLAAEVTALLRPAEPPSGGAPGELAGERERVRVLRMPVVVEPPDGSLAPPPSPPPVRLAAVGRFVHAKGFDVLVAAVELLVADGVEVRCEIVGDGPDAERLAGSPLVRDGIVRLLPARPRAQLLELVTRAHALVVPSRNEGLGLVAVEALALGVPVVASRVGGLPEVVGDGDGLLVPPGDVEALAGALRRLPLPPPGGSAVARHNPHAVLTAHLAAYREAGEMVLAQRS